ncbi:MAG TPA: nucleotidyltransferase family protein, partial [Gemmatimonadaceae bacterium]|nr:nucleotidyltransferase family protein [Gemmatimonadaceae bacterium]
DASIVELSSRIRNWPWFIGVAELERATRIAWERLSSLGASPREEASARQLEQLATIAAFRAEHLKARLSETLDVLAREGIGVVLLKGAALATTVYPSFIERPMGDLDLMVVPADAERAHRAARSVGWKWNEGAFPAARYDGHHHLPPLDDAAGTGVRLELHRGIAIEGHPFALSLDDLRERGRTVQIGGKSAWVPSPELLLLHEAVHFAWSHVLSFGSWRTARDVQLMARVGEVDWDRFVETARRHRAESCAYWTLSLARLLAGANIPETVLQNCRPRLGGVGQRLLERHFIYHLFPIEEEWPSERLRRSLWEKAIQPEQYGHGAKRPWEFDDRGPEVTLVADGAPAPAKVDRLGKLGIWARYFRAVSSLQS